MSDLISRWAAIDAICGECQANCIPCECFPCGEIKAVQALPPAQPERLTDDDWETIRIHLNAYKEKLCNLHRWEEAEEYQRIINRFMSFASAHPEIIRCKDCKHWKDSDGVYRRGIGAESKCPVNIRAVYEGNFYCADAERRTDEID